MNEVLRWSGGGPGPGWEPVTLNEGGGTNTLTIGEYHVVKMWHLDQSRVGGGVRVGNHPPREKVVTRCGASTDVTVFSDSFARKLSNQVPASQVDAVL